jgi:hypothetical protein
MCTYNNGNISSEICDSFCNIIFRKKEDHKKTIYGISICQQSIPDESEEAFLFATCSINQVERIFNIDF